MLNPESMYSSKKAQFLKSDDAKYRLEEEFDNDNKNNSSLDNNEKPSS